MQDGTAVFEQSPALQRHLVFLNTPELCLVVVVLFPLKRVAREVTVQVNLEIVGLVSFLFCVSFRFVFYHLPVVLLLLVLSPTPCF